MCINNIVAISKQYYKVLCYVLQTKFMTRPGNAPEITRKMPCSKYIFGKLDSFLWKIKKTLWKSYFDFST